MFVNYWFIFFIIIFFPLYWVLPSVKLKKVCLLCACIIFHYRFAGPAGVIPIVILGLMTYIAGILNLPILRIITICACVATLIFYKYLNFMLIDVFSYLHFDITDSFIVSYQNSILSIVPPLAISFFVFEFVHYLTDVQRQKKPIRSLMDFSLFAIFWPSIVSGPIKRFQDFVPAISHSMRVSSTDIQIGATRVIIGLVKKLLIADNLTSYIDHFHPLYFQMDISHRWIILVAISLRILFDFSGYSDMAIGFARMMGIRLPENFNWPYLAVSLTDFWRRWHISLSTWIRDYIYIPLGGNQYGIFRKTINGLVAFSLCGLWHGAAWNFVFWGAYHGFGMLVSNYTKAMKHSFNRQVLYYPFIFLGWFATYLFVSIGWLFFFYPVNEAIKMSISLFRI